MKNPYIHPKGTVVSQRVSWTLEGEKLSDEEKQKITDDMFTRIDEHLSDVVVIPRQHMEHIFESLEELMKLSKMDIREWETIPKEVSSLKSSIFRHVEFAKMFARQCLELNKKGANHGSEKVDSPDGWEASR